MPSVRKEPMRVVRVAIALLGMFVVPAVAPAQNGASSDSAAVAVALKGFLTAFENLDWEPFRAAFSDSATVFHPSPDIPRRIIGRRAIDSTFRLVFAGIRAGAKSGPPYHHLTPVDLMIQPLAPGVVLATFQLENGERLARRTVVFRRETGGWRIFHLHASNMSR